jgi:Methyltransferase FkbM domain
MPLNALLDQHLPGGKQIDFMSIDAEGFDLAVLQSNDWQKYRPTVILIEDTAAKTWSLIGRSPITQYLSTLGYEPFASTFRTVLYRQPEQS